MPAGMPLLQWLVQYLAMFSLPERAPILNKARYDMYTCCFLVLTVPIPLTLTLCIRTRMTHTSMSVSSEHPSMQAHELSTKPAIHNPRMQSKWTFSHV
jgi:hypothetical protein